MSVITRQHAEREGHPVVTVGEHAWWVPHTPDHRWRTGTTVVPVRLLGGAPGRPGRPLRVSVQILEQATVPVTGEERDREAAPEQTVHAGQVRVVRGDEVGPDALRDHALRDPAITPVPTWPKWALDTHCPVHGFVHRPAEGLCDGPARRPPAPMPGDAVRLLSGPWTAGEVKPGALGVLEGMVGDPLTDTVSIVFNASSFRDDSVVSCSGGPAPAVVPVGELIRTDDTAEVRFWQWRHGIARAHEGQDYTLTVPVWDWHAGRPAPTAAHDPS